MAAVLAALAPAVTHCAETLYAASVRSGINAGAPSVAGSLYRINPSTGGIKLIGPIRIDGTLPIIRRPAWCTESRLNHPRITRTAWSR